MPETIYFDEYEKIRLCRKKLFSTFNTPNGFTCNNITENFLNTVSKVISGEAVITYMNMDMDYHNCVEGGDPLMGKQTINITIEC
jgi:hypothetical protein